MSDRKIKVTIDADTSAYLEAMRIATEATDRLRDSIREVRSEQNKPVAAKRYEGMPSLTVYADADKRPGLTIGVDEEEDGKIVVRVSTSPHDTTSVIVDGEVLR